MKKFSILLTVLLLTNNISPVAFAETNKQQKKEERKQKKAEKKKKKEALKQQKKAEKKKKKEALKQQKKDIKIWKKRKRKMEPLQLRDLVEENKQLKNENGQLKNNNAHLTRESNTAKKELEQLTKLEDKIKALCEQHGLPSWEVMKYENYAGIEALCSQPPSTASPEEYAWVVDQNGTHYIKGLIFKVQIGAYKQRDLSEALEGSDPKGALEQEQSADLNVYTLRQFKDYWKANTFKKELRAMGLKDTLIVAYQDGKRVPLKTVLKKISNQKK